MTEEYNDDFIKYYGDKRQLLRERNSEAVFAFEDANPDYNGQYVMDSDIKLGSVTDETLIQNPDWVRASRTVYDSFSRNVEMDAYRKRARMMQERAAPEAEIFYDFEAPSMDQTNASASMSDEEIARWGLEFMGDFNYNLPNMGVNTVRLQSADNETKVAFYKLMNDYDQLDISWDGAYRFFKGLATDPTTYIGLSTFGVGLVSRAPVREAGIQGIKEVIRRQIPFAAVNALETGGYAAYDEYNRQVVAVEAGQKESVDVGEVATSGGTGALGGALLSTVGPAVGKAGLQAGKAIGETIVGSKTKSAIEKGKRGVFKISEPMLKKRRDDVFEFAENRQPFNTVEEAVDANRANHNNLNSEILSISKDLTGSEPIVAPLKKSDRIAEKVNTKYDGNIKKVADVARSAITVASPRQADELVKKLGKSFTVIDEGYTVLPDGYFDRKLAVVFDNGTIGEVQIFAPGMREAKGEGGGHDMYKEFRSKNTSTERKLELQQMMKDLYGGVRSKLTKEWDDAIRKTMNPSDLTALERQEALELKNRLEQTQGR